MKPDIVYFGEPIPSDVAYRSVEKAAKCDMMLVCGTSAVIYPFASLPRIAAQIDAEYFQPDGTGSTAAIIEVNAEPTALTYEKISSYLIQGNTGQILPRIVEAMKNMSV
jgi:NAD-dependent deacetylase